MNRDAFVVRSVDQPVGGDELAFPVLARSSSFPLLVTETFLPMMSFW